MFEMLSPASDLCIGISFENAFVFDCHKTNVVTFYTCKLRKNDPEITSLPIHDKILKR